METFLSQTTIWHILALLGHVSWVFWNILNVFSPFIWGENSLWTQRFLLSEHSGDQCCCWSTMWILVWGCFTAGLNRCLVILPLRVWICAAMAQNRTDDAFLLHARFPPWQVCTLLCSSEILNKNANLSLMLHKTLHGSLWGTHVSKILDKMLLDCAVLGSDGKHSGNFVID